MTFTVAVFVLFITLLGVLIVSFFTQPAASRHSAIFAINAIFLVFLLLAFIFQIAIEFTLPVAFVWMLAFALTQRHYEKAANTFARVAEEEPSPSKTKVRPFRGRRVLQWIIWCAYMLAVFASLGLVRRLPQDLLQILTNAFWIVVIVMIFCWTTTGMLTMSLLRGMKTPIKLIRAAVLVSTVLTFIVGWAAWPLVAGHYLLKSPVAIVAILVMFTPALVMEHRPDKPSTLRPLNYVDQLCHKRS